MIRHFNPVADACKAYRRYQKWRKAKTVHDSDKDQQFPGQTPSEVLDAAINLMDLRTWSEREHQWAVWADMVIDDCDNRTNKQPNKA